MTKPRGLYKEYIQILPATQSGEAAPMISVGEGFVGVRAITASSEVETPVAANSNPPANSHPPHAAALAPPVREHAELEPTVVAFTPRERPQARAIGSGPAALIAATLALAVSTGVLTWTVMSPPRENAEVVALSTAVSELKGRIAALDEEAKGAVARVAQVAERLDRTDEAQAAVVGRLAALEGGLDNRISAAAQAAVAVAIPAPADITAAISSLPRPVEPTPPKPPVVPGWVVRDAAPGLALVEGRRGYYEVAVGTPLPGLGRVQAIHQRNGRTVVVTPGGVILPP